jgi:hypothetical protein
MHRSSRSHVQHMPDSTGDEIRVGTPLLKSSRWTRPTSRPSSPGLGRDSCNILKSIVFHGADAGFEEAANGIVTT